MPQTKTQYFVSRVTEAEFLAAVQVATLLDINLSEFVRRAVAEYIKHQSDADARKVAEQQQ
jgi:predicted DNA-binding ribbon-helix-helix protein